MTKRDNRLEKALEKEIKEYLTFTKAFWYKTHGSVYTVSGLPDIICCIRGKFVGIEVKRPDKSKARHSDVQKVQKDCIERAGGVYILANDFESFKKEVDSL